jgi:hypothetical protein
MPIYKLKCDRMYNTWWRDHYEIQADSIEEAVNIILEGDVVPYDTESIIPDLNFEPRETEILDGDGNVFYSTMRP